MTLKLDMTNLETGVDFFAISAPVYQWQCGIRMELTGVPAPQTRYVAHITKADVGVYNTFEIENVTVAADGTLKFEIPDSLFQTAIDVLCYIFDPVGEKQWKTVRQIRIPVIRHAKPPQNAL